MTTARPLRAAGPLGSQEIIWERFGRWEWIMPEGAGRSLRAHRVKLDGILDDGKEARGLIADHEARIRTLEKSRWPLPTIGVLAGVAGAVTGALSLLGR